MKTHQKKEDHVCERCPATFSRKDNLIKHKERVHSLANINVGLIRGSGVTEFICQMCGRNFGSDNSNLEAHLLLKPCRQANKQENVELDDKLRFPCDQCDKRMLICCSLHCFNSIWSGQPDSYIILANAFSNTNISACT